MLRFLSRSRCQRLNAVVVLGNLSCMWNPKCLTRESVDGIWAALSSGMVSYFHQTLNTHIFDNLMFTSENEQDQRKHRKTWIHRAYCNIEKGERGVAYRQKRYFLKLWKDADRKCLFCSNVSTLLSMIVVGFKIINKSHNYCGLSLIKHIRIDWKNVSS